MIDDLVDAQGNVLAPRVAEGDDVVGAEALDRIVERVQEHPAPELAVRDHIESEIDLAPDRVADRLVLERTQLRPIPRALVGEDGRMTPE